MNLASRWIGATTWGAAAGLGALGLDELLAYLTLGFEMPLATRFVVAYAVSGAVVAGLFEAGRLARRKPAVRALEIVAATAVVLYGAGLAERIVQALAGRVPQPLAVLATAGVLGLYATGIFVLRRIAGARLAPHALLVGALGTAVVLAVNRNVVTRPFEAAALAADAAVVVVMLILAFVLRRFGPLRGWAPVGLLLVAAVAWQAAPPAGKPAVDPSSRPPHLVLVCIDTLRQDVFRAVVDETAEGRAFREALGPAAWFDNAVAAAPWTPPSVATLLSGLYPPEHGFGRADAKKPGSMKVSRRLTRLPDSVTTLAERLVEHGYRTEAIVANPMLHPVTGIGQGFERYATLQSTISKLPLLTALVRSGVLPGDAYQSASTVRRLLGRRLRPASPAQAPWFLWLHLMDPHHPLWPHPELASDPGARDLDELERLYRDEVRYTLLELVRMLGLLQSHGYWDDAVFVLTSDHGEMLPGDQHGHLPPDWPMAMGHGHALYEELVRVPLVIRPVGGLPAERRLDVLASHADLFDTIVDLLGLDVPRIAQDRLSLAPWLSSTPWPSSDRRRTGPPRRRFALSGGIHRGPEQRAVRTDSHKLIHFPNGELPDELYDLRSDPGELESIAVADARTLRELRELLAYSWSQLRDSPDDVEALEVDEETRRRLKALGYLR